MDPAASLWLNGNETSFGSIVSFFGSVSQIGGRTTNFASDYGHDIASAPSDVAWFAPVTVSVVAGANVCDASPGACSLTLRDAFLNTPTTPTVVEIGVGDSQGRIMSGPQYVLVADGTPAVIPSLSVGLVSASADVVPLTVVGVTVFGRMVDVPDAVASTWYHVSSCPLGHGAVVSPSTDGADGDAVIFTCATCEAGTYSDAVASWDPCAACPAGTATAPGAVGSEACEWCAPGYGWDDGDGCVACSAGSFSANVTFREPCTGCGSGLTTSGDGAVLCAVPLVPTLGVGLTTWWIWAAVGGFLICLVACVGAIAWRSSRRKVMSHYYIGRA